MKITADGTEINVVFDSGFQEDYLCLTDLARWKNPYEPKDVVKNWLRLRSTIEFLGLWEQLYNPNFKGVEFDTFKNESGSNAFTLTPQRWIEKTNAIGSVFPASSKDTADTAKIVTSWRSAWKFPRSF